MCDKLVFDLSQEVEGTPNVFVRKDWINILDNQNQNYNNKNISRNFHNLMLIKC